MIEIVVVRKVGKELVFGCEMKTNLLNCKKKNIKNFKKFQI